MSGTRVCSVPLCGQVIVAPDPDPPLRALIRDAVSLSGWVEPDDPSDGLVRVRMPRDLWRRLVEAGRA